MPVYEYECLGCAEIHELMRPIDQRGFFAVCPKCGRGALQVMSAPSFSVNGFSAKNGYSDNRKEKD